MVSSSNNQDLHVLLWLFKVVQFIISNPAWFFKCNKSVNLVEWDKGKYLWETLEGSSTSLFLSPLCICSFPQILYKMSIYYTGWCTQKRETISIVADCIWNTQFKVRKNKYRLFTWHFMILLLQLKLFLVTFIKMIYVHFTCNVYF